MVLRIDRRVAADRALKHLVMTRKGIAQALKNDTLELIDPFRKFDPIGEVLFAARELIEIEISGLDPGFPGTYRDDLFELRDAISNFLSCGGSDCLDRVIEGRAKANDNGQ